MQGRTDEIASSWSGPYVMIDAKAYVDAPIDDAMNGRSRLDPGRRGPGRM
jgi:hypothetical protein